MNCGFFELDITPPLGSIIPGAYAARYAKEIWDPLYARAMVVQNDDSALAIVSIDACGITADITEAIRNRVCSLVPMQPEQIMVMATHTHGGGPTLNWGEEVVRNERYLQVLAEKAADSIVVAWQRAVGSQFLLGKELLTDVSFIRVYKMKDGSLKTNPGAGNPDILKPSTSIDPEVIVLAVRQEDTYAGALINFANHPAIVASTKITGDYISALSAELKKQYGPQFVTVFINGACGNINHLNPNDPETRAPGRHKVVGKKIADAAVSAIEKAVPMTDETLRFSCNTIQVKLRKPTMEQLIAAKELFDSKGDELVNCVPKTNGYGDIFSALQVLQIQADKRTVQNVALQLLRIGSCFIFGTPCQLFVQFGKRMKSACDTTAMVSAFANDYRGYVPTPECMRPGVYEAKLAPTSALEPAAGDKICEAMIALYETCK